MTLGVGSLAPEVQVRPVFGGALQVPDPSGRDLLLVFGRHLGSPFTRALVDTLHHALDDLREARVQPVFFTESGLDRARDFVPRHHVLFPVVSDPEGTLFQRFGVGLDAGARGTLGELWSRGLRSLAPLLRHLPGPVDAPLHRLPAAFRVDGTGQVTWAWVARSIADLPDLSGPWVEAG